MRTINEIKKFKFENGEWLDENENKLNTIWSEKNERGTNVEHTIFEKIEATEIDGIVYTHITYVYGEGLVLVDDSQRNRIKVSELNREAKQENTINETQKNETRDNLKEARYTEIHNDVITSTLAFSDNSIILLHGTKYRVILKETKHLNENEIECYFGGWAIEDEETKKMFSTQYIYNYETIN